MINEYVTQSKYRNMKHKTIESIDTAYNIVKIGGNSCIKYIYTFIEDYMDVRKGFVDLIRKYGYDVLSKNDQEFKEKLDSYNQVLKLQAKKNGLSSYTKYELEELCVCGDYIFSEKDPDVEMVKETKIQDLRGGKREGAGRKAKHSKLIDSQTAVIRVPMIYKKEIKNFIDWLIDKAEEEQDVDSALFWSERALEEKGDKENAQLLEELRMKLPDFSVRK